ncbi:MAG: isoprenylcysteine carboxylmethyltransferase family protein [Cocleimonas sp.]|nr:isoprenylcysteine carboxylmethyltransferase family protein [Cocleimonas sp.]
MLKLRIPPPLYALMIGALMWLLNQHAPLVHWIPSPWNKMGLLLMVIAFSFELWSALLFFRSHTTVNPMKPEHSKKIVTTGTYQFTRNPMYLGLLTVLSGYAIWLGAITPFLLLPLFVLLITTQQIIPEEEMLEKNFGKTYLDYKEKVRRWL